MKTFAAPEKTGRTGGAEPRQDPASGTAARQDPSSGAQAAALRPPACGIEFVDGFGAGAIVQRKEVSVQGGTFKDLEYKAQNGGGKTVTRGARMILEFKPSDFLEAQEVSLVQSTNSTLRNLSNPHVPDQPESLLNERRTRGGTAIDQQIYLPERKFQLNPFKAAVKPAVVNLDPRYHEERHAVTDPLYDPRKIPFGGGQAAIPYTQEQREQGGVTDRWRPATLKDEPGHTINPNERLTGAERFEVAAMAAGTRFLGSIRWGWRIDDHSQLAELDPATIEPMSATSASREFFAAAAAWNAMPVPDRQGGEPFRTIQLPTRTRELATGERMSVWLRGLMNRYPNVQQDHLSDMSDADCGEFLLTGKIAAWEGGEDAGPATDHQDAWNRTFNDLLEVYPQGEQYLSDLSRQQFGEFLLTGRIDAWEH